MRKLREAAVVAVMVGSVSMLGAGVASAGGWEPEHKDKGWEQQDKGWEHQDKGWEPEKQEFPTVNCDQDASRNESNTTVASTVTVTPLGPGGDADASATQQICGVDNSDNDNEAGEATGGIGTGAL